MGGRVRIPLVIKGLGGPEYGLVGPGMVFCEPRAGVQAALFIPDATSAHGRNRSTMSLGRGTKPHDVNQCQSFRNVI